MSDDLGYPVEWLEKIAAGRGPFAARAAERLQEVGVRTQPDPEAAFEWLAKMAAYAPPLSESARAWRAHQERQQAEDAALRRLARKAVVAGDRKVMKLARQVMATG